MNDELGRAAPRKSRRLDNVLLPIGLSL